MTPQDYLKLKAPNINGRLKKIRNGIKEIEEKAQEVLKQFDPFCHEKFRLNYIFNNPLFLQTKQKKVEAITTQQNPFEFDFKPYEKKS
ncbi:hypothetical protein HNQ91_000768 [Filimonas zeae]|uniref:Uncharacterized protein n=1 Tax=Filimonas zeae TaxID=1737353 RepID=A0A917INY5_9BACT|nr:hypothetical protein [Filimonas zeae]GGH60079.1 hypothetical protein GCM10011379_07530 [Filimonas zeae]